MTSTNVSASPGARTPKDGLKVGSSQDKAPEDAKVYRKQSLGAGAGHTPPLPPKLFGHRSQTSDLNEKYDLLLAKRDKSLSWEEEGGFNLSAKLKKRLESAQLWVEMVTAEKFTASSRESLRSGVRLCRMINSIYRTLGQPDKFIPIAEEQNVAAYCQNIQNFLRASKDLGVEERLLFSPSDLLDVFDADNAVTQRAMNELGPQSLRHKGPNVLSLLPDHLRCRLDNGMKGSRSMPALHLLDSIPSTAAGPGIGSTGTPSSMEEGHSLVEEFDIWDEATTQPREKGSRSGADGKQSVEDLEKQQSKATHSAESSHPGPVMSKANWLSLLEDYELFTEKLIIQERTASTPRQRGQGEDAFEAWQLEEKLRMLIVGEIPNSGVPSDLHGKLWLLLSNGQKELINYPGYFDYLVRSDIKIASEEVAALYVDAITQIDADLPRTFGGDVCGKTYQKVVSLRRVLLAYVRHNPKLGYCQGFNFIVARLLDFVEEEEAFWLLVQLVRIVPPDYFTNMLGVAIDQHVFADLVASRIPEVANHLQRLGGTGMELSLTCTEWFLTLFASPFPRELTAAVWDYLFISGDEILFQVALALVRRYKEDLLHCKTSADLLTILNNIGPQEIDATSILQDAKKERTSSWSSLIEDLRLRHRLILSGLAAGAPQDRIFVNSEAPLGPLALSEVVTEKEIGYQAFYIEPPNVIEDYVDTQLASGGVKKTPKLVAYPVDRRVSLDRKFKQAVRGGRGKQERSVHEEDVNGLYRRDHQQKKDIFSDWITKIKREREMKEERRRERHLEKRQMQLERYQKRHHQSNQRSISLGEIDPTIISMVANHPLSQDIEDQTMVAHRKSEEARRKLSGDETKTGAQPPQPLPVRRIRTMDDVPHTAIAASKKGPEALPAEFFSSDKVETSSREAGTFRPSTGQQPSGKPPMPKRRDIADFPTSLPSTPPEMQLLRNRKQVVSYLKKSISAAESLEVDDQSGHDGRRDSYLDRLSFGMEAALDELMSSSDSHSDVSDNDHALDS